MSLEDIALRFEGLNDAQIVQLRLTLQDVAHLVTVVEQELPRIKRSLSGLEMAITALSKRI